MFLLFASVFLCSLRGRVAYQADGAGTTGGSDPVVVRRLAYDPADKILLQNPLVMADFVRLSFPTLHLRVGRTTPFTAQDIKVRSLEWVKGGTPDDPDLSSRRSDVVAYLYHAGRLVAMVPVEVQARYQPEMTARMHNYVGHALDAYYQGERTKERTERAYQPPLVAPLLIAMGHTPWRADGGPWVMAPGPEDPPVLAPTRTYARQDLADWQDQPRDNPSLPHWMAAFFHMALLRADSREVLSLRLAEASDAVADRTATVRDWRAAVQGLADRTLALMRRLEAKARTEDRATELTEESCLYWLVRWVNGALRPIWSGILDREIPAFDTLEGLAMFNEVVKEVRDAYQANMEFVRDTYHAQGHAQGQALGHAQGRAEEARDLAGQAVANYGAMPPSELAEYRKALDSLPAYQIPNALEVAARLLDCPGAQRRAMAWDILDEARAVPAPQATDAAPDTGGNGKR